MNKSKQKTTTIIVVMFAVAIAVVIGFWSILEHGRNKAEEQELIHSDNEEVNALLNKDLNIHYPGTPREVLKMYSRLQICAYNQKLSDKDLEAVTKQMRLLFDDELLEANSLEQQLEDLKKEIAEYGETKSVISNYVIDKESSVTEREIKGKEYATLVVSYLVNKQGGYNKTYEQFILRKDSKGKWKILGWELVKGEEEKQE